MKTPEDIIILHLFTKNLDDIIYSSWNIECDNCNWKLWAISFHFTHFPKNPKNQNFEKMKKVVGDIIILHMYTKKKQSIEVRFLRCGVKKVSGDVIILHMCTKNHNHMLSVISATDIIFCTFTPYWPLKLKFRKKSEKTWRYVEK